MLTPPGKEGPLHEQPIRITVSPDRPRRSSSAPPPPLSMANPNDDDKQSDHPLPRSQSSLSVRFSPEPPEVYEYPSDTPYSKPEPPSGPVLALPWHPT